MLVEEINDDEAGLNTGWQERSCITVCGFYERLHGKTERAWMLGSASVPSLADYKLCDLGQFASPEPKFPHL